MAWMLVHPQINNIFASLGVQHGNAYQVSEDCLEILSDILKKLSLEDRTLRSFRRAIGLGQHIRKDLLPLLIHVKDDTKTREATKILDATIKILVNLTIPVECLLSTDAAAKTDVGRHIIFDINKLLYSSKEAFVDARSIKAVTDHMKFVIKGGANLEMEQCDSINNCLLLLRNILHVPEHRMQISNCPLAHSSLQNRILWNLFTQSIDKLLLHLMTYSQRIYWVVTIVQLIALMYKDQHIGSLQKLLNVMLEASLSESSDDNESNTSPPPTKQDSGDSSPMLTSDPTSDSSDNGGYGRKIENSLKNQNGMHIVRSHQNKNKILLTSQKQKSTDDSSSSSSHMIEYKKDDQQGTFDNSTSVCYYMNALRAQKRKLSQPAHKNDHLNDYLLISQPDGSTKSKDNQTQQSSELSDYGYGTQVENQGSISTSSNDDETPQQKPVHQKPHMLQKPRNKSRTTIVSTQDKKEHRRKKLIKRSKSNIINMKGLLHYSPTDEDISNILKEFTVDFLLKGYGSLVQELYKQKISNTYLEIDTSHIFWLITYFLKFATQLKLEYEHIESVLCYKVIAYLTYEGVSLCEQLEIGFVHTGTDLKPNLRRMHLVVTAIKEFLLALEDYKKLSHLSKEEELRLRQLQIQVASIDNLRNLFLLLIRCYNNEIQSKNYLQDVIITNHILLLFLDDTTKLEDYTGNLNIEEHLKHFANVDVMQKYGYLLDDFDNNGKYVNDCIFTMMHHIGGDIDNVSTLFQPKILKTFSKIWESGYDMCDDWSDLIEYVIHKFINAPRQPNLSKHTPSDNNSASHSVSNKNNDEWPTEDLDSLYWYYVQSRNEENVIENIENLYFNNGVTNKTRTDIIKHLFIQKIITKDGYNTYIKIEQGSYSINDQNIEESHYHHDLQGIKEQLVKENMGNSILWLQKKLLEVCHSKVIINHKTDNDDGTTYDPISYCYIKLDQSIPIVPWTREQQNMLNNSSFILLLHNLGFHLPVDAMKLFVRIPHFWTADYIYAIAQKLGPIDPETLNFDVNLLKSDEYVDSPMPLNTNDNDENEASALIVQYPLLLNASASWFQSGLHTTVTPVRNFHQALPSSEVLSISISEIKTENDSPDTETWQSLHMLPEDIVKEESSTQTDLTDHGTSKITTSPETDNLMITNDNEEDGQYSLCDTTSVTSDLTRMYVSDEEEK